MAQVSTAGTHCKFEASDSVSDEVVLLKILDVLRNTLTGRLGEVLSDESVCEMMETGLSMCCQMRLSGAFLLTLARIRADLSGRSEMLRRSAERTMHAMVAAVFSNLRHVPAELGLSLHQFSSTLSLDESTAEHVEGELVGLGVRMTAPDPRSGQIPAAKEVEVGAEVEGEKEAEERPSVEVAASDGAFAASE